ncbi:MAG TPA: glycosyltransferase family 4 protein [Verrucomicrobiae bacterium]|jgi:glycosyltransferase involved in cell wall biosynthesis|nr:glycosyltransferase family 4 protein [Verrucomicrobiae bacterium]
MPDQAHTAPLISLLTGGRDPHYTIGFAVALADSGVTLDFIGSDDLSSEALRGSPRINVLNLRGDQSVNASLPKKVLRVLAYYVRLIKYAISARTKVFHILWNNKCEFFDRTVLMALYKLLGKKITFTAHNVNVGVRDGRDSFLNRATLKFQYRLCDRIFVHTDKMKAEVIAGFGVPSGKVVLIPYGWNNMVPNSTLTGPEARRRVGLSAQDRVILFYGNIAPYKGAEYLVEAFDAIADDDPSLKLIIAGRPKGPKSYWADLAARIAASRHSDRICQKIEFVSDADTELYFKAADVSVLPYLHIFQSGVLFLSYSFGLPAIATDVGSLKEDVHEGETGYTCEPANAAALAGCIRKYFQSSLYQGLEARRPEIRCFVEEKHSWNQIANIIIKAYSQIIHEEKDPGLLSQIQKDHETVSFNSHPGL